MTYSCQENQMPKNLIGKSTCRLELTILIIKIMIISKIITTIIFKRRQVASIPHCVGRSAGLSKTETFDKALKPVKYVNETNEI